MAKSSGTETWNRVPGLVYILVAQYFAAFAIGTAVSSWVQLSPILGCPARGSVSALSILLFVGGVAAAGWSARRMLRPAIVDVVSRQSLLLVTWLSHASAPSTHPIYVTVDLFAAAMVALLLLPFQSPPSISGCWVLSGYLMSRVAVAVALAFPLLRVFSWYALRRQIVGSTKEAVLPVVRFFVLAMPAFGVFFLAWGSSKIAASRLPVVDASSFAGGLAAHPELAGQLVKVRGHRSRAHASRCVCDDPSDASFCKVGALLLDLGPAGQVVYHAAGSGSVEVFAFGEGAADDPVEVIGRLGPLPDPKKQPFNVLDCGWGDFGPLLAEGRAFVELEYP